MVEDMVRMAEVIAVLKEKEKFRVPSSVTDVRNPRDREVFYQLMDADDLNGVRVSLSIFLLEFSGILLGYHSIDWLIDWSLDYSFDWLVDRSIIRLIDWLLDWLIDRSIIRSFDWLLDWLSDWSLFNL